MIHLQGFQDNDKQDSDEQDSDEQDSDEQDSDEQDTDRQDTDQQDTSSVRVNRSVMEYHSKFFRACLQDDRVYLDGLSSLTSEVEFTRATGQPCKHGEHPGINECFAINTKSLDGVRKYSVLVDFGRCLLAFLRCLHYSQQLCPLYGAVEHTHGDTYRDGKDKYFYPRRIRPVEQDGTKPGSGLSVVFPRVTFPCETSPPLFGCDGERFAVLLHIAKMLDCEHSMDYYERKITSAVCSPPDAIDWGLIVSSVSENGQFKALLDLCMEMLTQPILIDGATHGGRGYSALFRSLTPERALRMMKQLQPRQQRAT